MKERADAKRDTIQCHLSVTLRFPSTVSCICTATALDLSQRMGWGNWLSVIKEVVIHDKKLMVLAMSYG